MTSHRLGSKGHRIERGEAVAFTFDDKQYFGLQGDTLASALLANGVRIVGRSFKYHRPRGIMAAGVDEPNGLVTLITDGVREPNVRATEIEIFDGLRAKSQNRFPSLQWDLLSLSALAGKALSAGFYYKTFMGPVIGPLQGTRFWMLCEHFIRRAAGLGAADTTPDPSRYERMNAFCNVLVVGGGEAGMRQALDAADDGKNVILCELAPNLGGFNSASNEALRDQINNHDNIRVLTRTTVWGYYDGNTLAAVERVSDHKHPRNRTEGEPRQRYWIIRADHVALATGALERPIAFPGNDRPGVMLASAAWHYAENFGVATGQQVVIFTNNDSAYDTARAMKDRGVFIKAIIDTRAEMGEHVEKLVEGLDCEWLKGHAVIATKGSKALRAVCVARYNGDTNSFTGNARDIACDCLAVSGGWSPVVHLMSQAGAKPVWDSTKQAFVPPQSTGAWSAHGMAAGEFDFNTAPTLEVKLPGKSFVDFQHDVTADDVRLAHREGFISVEHLKRYTTLGMATDQGKSSNVVGLSIMAEALGKPIDQVGTTRFRPPYTAASIGSIAAERYGDLFPHRLTPMHDWHVEAGARMYAAGRWDRPESYNRAGETVEQAYVREAKNVRTNVGLVDVSTLGKIDIQGPDAAAFLNRVYSNGFAKLPVGKARYGLMLREDGFAMDDGTTWRLAENRFLMTTTTANAGPVMQHMEKLLAVHWPDLKVHLTSVTDQWAGMALAGPKARTVLEDCVTGTPVDNATLPFMGIVYGAIDDVPVMICRLSFSGELAYEIYCGAHHGTHVWEAVMDAGKLHNICAYGLEALGTLRIEKGHVTAAEIDGRTTAHDLHLDWMLSTKKTYVGSAMINREGL
ncbi:MAG: 2Fe-2S iron-sulfur cluster-binding protein, partial [Ahrensia sp.]